MITKAYKQTEARVLIRELIIYDGVRSFNYYEHLYTIGGTYTDTELLIALKTIYDTDKVKIISIIYRHEYDLILGMTEDDFFKYANVVDVYENRNS